MSPSAELCILAFVFLSKADIASGQTGMNKIVSLRHQAVLDCLVSSLISTQWTRTTDGISNSLPIADGCSVNENNAEYYSTELLGGNVCRLTIRNATMQQSGVYICFDGSSTPYRSLVTVIDPVANVVVHNQSNEIVEGDQLNISCSINFTGPSSPAPSILPKPYFTSPGQRFTNFTYPSANVVTVVATVRVQRPTVSIFQCNTVFEITGNTTNYNATAPADNIPLGNSTECDVQYVPLKPTLTIRHDEHCESSAITCSSKGNPAPNYRWQNSIDLRVTLNTNDTLTLKEINEKNMYMCQAYNTIRNVTNYSPATCNVSGVDCTFIVKCRGATTIFTSGNSCATVIAAAVAVGVFLFIGT